MSLKWKLHDIFLMIRLGLWVGGRKKNKEIKGHFHQIISMINVTIMVDVDLDHLAEVLSVSPL